MGKKWTPAQTAKFRETMAKKKLLQQRPKAAPSVPQPWIPQMLRLIADELDRSQA